MIVHKNLKMINKHLYKGKVWIDLDHPTQDEIKSLMDEYNIDPLVAHELTSPTPKPKIEFHKNFVYFILHFPAFKHSHSEGNSIQEVDFIVGKNFVVTARYDTVDALLKCSKTFEVDTILNKKMTDSPSGILFFKIIKELYGSLSDELAFIEDWTQDIEKRIFKNKEKEMVFALSQVSRNLLDFKKAIDMHEGILNSLRSIGEKLFGEEFIFHAQVILGEYHKIKNTIINNMESIAELRETNNALLSTKQNEEMRVLTTLALVVLPWSLIAALFQMGLNGTPFIKNPNGFWIVISILIAVTGAQYAFFKYKKWL